MKTKPKVILSNSVGTITAETVKIKPAKGGPATIALADIVAFKHQLKRKYGYAAFCFLFGLGALVVVFFPTAESRFSVGSFLVPVVLIIAGLANLLGYYVLEIQTKTGTIRLEDVEFTKLKDGKKFIETLEKMIPAQAQASVGTTPEK